MDYRTQRSLEIDDKLQQILSELPDMVRGFVRSIASSTTDLTRLAYVSDLRQFFFCLCERCAPFRGKKPSEVTCDDLMDVTLEHLEIFQEYLRRYERPDYEGESTDESIILMNQNISISRKLTSVRTFFKYLYKHDLISANITEKVQMPKRTEKPIIYLERDEIDRMYDAVNNGDGLSKRQKAYAKNTRIRDRAIIGMLIGTGIRSSELIGLDIDDIDLDNSSFMVTRKGNKQQILYFNDQVRDVLADYLVIRKEITPCEGSEYALFLSLQRKRLARMTLYDLVKKYAQVGAPLKQVSPHKMRSTFGTTLYKETGDIYLVATTLGHSDINTTKKHYAAEDEERRKMASKMVDWVK